MNIEKEIEKDGYKLLITGKKQREENAISNDFVSVYLNEEKNDFIIVLANKNKSKEWSVEEANNNLVSKHPVLQVINKLQQFKNIDNGLTNIEIKPKKIKM